MTSVELRSGFPLLLQQFTALSKKNFLLSWRNKRATLLQVLSPLFFIFLIFAIDKAIETQYSTTTYFKNLTDPIPLPSPPITPCENKFFVKLPSYDFVWSGDQNPKFHTMSNNPGRVIPPSKTSLAFMLSAFIHKSSSETSVGFSIFIVAFVTQLVVKAGFPYNSNISKTIRTIFSFFPPNPFAQGLKVLSDAVSTAEYHGVSLSKRGDCTTDDLDCVMTMRIEDISWNIEHYLHLLLLL